MPRKTGIDPTQFGLFATPLDAMIAPDAEVRVVAAFVDQLDFDALGFSRVRSTGASSYAPGTLLKIYIYGYLNRIRSSRRLEKACKLNIELMWLTGRLEPCYHTIADFRKNHPKAIKQVFKEYVLLLKKWSLIGGERLAIDGTKVQAQNARKKNFNEAKIKRHLDRIDKRIEEELAEYDRIDAYEDDEDKNKLLSDKQSILDTLKERKQKYDKLQEKLDESGEKQISLTDSDARALIAHGKESVVGYNVQSVVDAQEKLIVHTEATNVNDLNALGGLIETVDRDLDLEDGADILSDKGYHNSVEMAKVQALGHKTFVAERRHASQKEKSNYSATEDFFYDKHQDAYICREGKLLKTTGKVHTRTRGDHSFKMYRASRYDCGVCPQRETCLGEASLAANHSRSIARAEHAEAVEVNRWNLKQNPEVYQQRQALVEHPFGTIKRHWTGYYTLLKGLDKVDGEFSLLALCYNLRRSMSILGVLELIERLKGRFLSIWANLAPSSTVMHQVNGQVHDAVWRMRCNLAMAG